MADFEQFIPDWYTFALERLVAVVGELSQARDVDTVAAIVRVAARELTGADGATFVLRDGDQCYYAEENAIAPLWKGKRFPMAACVSGWVMLNKQPAVIEDIYADSRVPAEAYRPTFVKSLAMVPIRRNAPIGAIGNYWSSNYRPSSKELALLEALADTTSVALENAELYSRLREQVSTLETQQANQEVFTLALAHDLKEPVRTLVAYSGMLQEGPEEVDAQASYLSYIHNAAGRMDMLINAVARYTRLDDPSNPEPSPCNLNEIVENVRQNLSMLLAERHARLDAGRLPWLNANPAHLTQLMQNLIANAVLHNDRPVTVTIRHGSGAGHSVFSVGDNGDGFAQAQAEQVFLPFRRLTHREDCAGLGLAICRRITALYGGEIGCEAVPGEGATFIFSLPDTEQADFDTNSKPAA